MASLNPDSATNNGVGSVANHALEPFFGKVDPQYQKMLAEDKFAHETFNLPKAYEGKNKYLGLFVVLLFGSFVIPMAQYFWYVRDTPDSLFANEEPPPPPPAPKKFWER